RTTRLRRPRKAPFVSAPSIAHGPEPALPSRHAPDAAASTTSRPASVTIAIRPSGGRACAARVIACHVLGRQDIYSSSWSSGYLFEPTSDCRLQEGSVGGDWSGVARAMAPDARDRRQLGMREMRHFPLVVGNTKIEIGLPRQQQDASLDRSQSPCEVAPVERVGADVTMVPCDELGIAIGGAAALERCLPVISEISVEIWCAQRRKMQFLPIEVLAQRPARIDMADGTECRARFLGKSSIAEMFVRGLEGAQQTGEEDLVVFGGAGAATHHDDA